MRLFVGIAVPEEVAIRVRVLVDKLKPLAALRWSQVADLHVTTKFIGEQPPTRVAEIERALGALPARDPFVLSIRGMGWFPHADAPRVLWVGVDAPPGLSELATDAERALAPLGIAIERRQYSPHVTLARVTIGARLEALRQALVALPSTEFGAFIVDRFTLYESRLSDKLARYHPLASFSLVPSSQAGV
jgi:RNA 2',3'-cyclic 3'-phosphodiesterase